MILGLLIFKFVLIFFSWGNCCVLLLNFLDICINFLKLFFCKINCMEWLRLVLGNELGLIGNICVFVMGVNVLNNFLIIFCCVCFGFVCFD